MIRQKMTECSCCKWTAFIVPDHAPCTWLVCIISHHHASSFIIQEPHDAIRIKSKKHQNSSDCCKSIGKRFVVSTSTWSLQGSLIVWIVIQLLNSVQRTVFIEHSTFFFFDHQSLMFEKWFATFWNETMNLSNENWAYHLWLMEMTVGSKFVWFVWIPGSF